jgi:hypothetical protein
MTLLIKMPQMGGFVQVLFIEKSAQRTFGMSVLIGRSPRLVSTLGEILDRYLKKLAKMG